jgi:DNA-binding winged helix-turn-helix (wHTH) protein/tetratricopeptide (TPR) repeat protein
LANVLYRFAEFELDGGAYQLKRHHRAVRLERIPLDLLFLLLERNGEAVTREEILERVWGKGVFLDTENAINTAVRKLRHALGDEARTPKFIETVHRRGYRFAAVATRDSFAVAPEAPPSPPPILVGREAELARMREWYTQASAGQRRVIFVTGEAGIGKSTFVGAFLDSVALGNHARIGRGQCVQQYGSGEPYMPVLEALTRLAQAPGGARVVETLREFAPSWLLQIPAILSDSERERLQTELRDVTQLRMLREIGHALEALTTDAPLVLLLEDLHWSDFSTVELISAIARRSEPARLLIVGTFRPETLSGEHPLRSTSTELEIHHQCEELQLGPLSEADVAIYLTHRFGDDDGRSLAQAASLVFRRTEGNPLYMVNVVDYLVEHGSLHDESSVETPRTIQQMIELNLDRLEPIEQRLLEAASIAGREFSAASVATALESAVGEVEERCAHLARRRQFIVNHGSGAWPDGTVASRFRFQHALYGEVLYGRVPAGRQSELHRRIAEREERAFGELAIENAAALAHHYSRANVKDKAIEYFLLAGEHAARRAAYREAVVHFTLALEAMEALPPSAARDEMEFKILAGLRRGLVTLKGLGGDERMPALLDRESKLCRRTAQDSKLAPVLNTLTLHHLYAGNTAAGAEIAEEGFKVATRTNHPARIAGANWALGLAHFHMGLFPAVRAEMERALRPNSHERSGAKVLNHSLEVAQLGILNVLSRTLWMLGFSDQARRRCSEFIDAGRCSGEPATFANALSGDLDVYYYCGQIEAVAEHLTTFHQLLATMESEDFQMIGWARMMEGWLIAEQGNPKQGLSLVRDGFDVVRASGNRISTPLFGYTLANAQARAGDLGEALETVEWSLTEADQTGQHYFDCELQRVREEFLLMRGSTDVGEAERCFHHALDIARHQSAKSWELRATMSLARLLDRQGRRDEARRLLADIYGWFTEGFDTHDLQEAKALLTELNQRPRRARIG